MPAQAERAAQQARDEAALRMETLAAMAEADRVDQMTAARRRMRVEEHRREAERLVAAKREAFERAQVWRALATVANVPSAAVPRGGPKLLAEPVHATDATSVHCVACSR